MTTQSESDTTIAKPLLLTKPAQSNGLHPGGRPSYTLTDEQQHFVARCAAHGVSQLIIADALGLPRDTINGNQEFSDIFKKAYAEAGCRVAHRQYELLESDKEQTAALMAIWLGKQHLGQRDSNQEAGGPVQVRIILEGMPSGQVVEGEVRELPPNPAPDTQIT